MCQAIPHLEQLITGGVEKGVRHCRFQMLAGGDGVPYRQGWVSPSVIAIISPRDATADPATFFRQHRDQQFVDPEGSLGQLCCDAGLAFSGRCVEWNTPLVSDAARSSTLTVEAAGSGSRKGRSPRACSTATFS